MLAWNKNQLSVFILRFFRYSWLS